MLHGLGLHCRVHDHLVQAALGKEAGRLARGDGGLQELFHPGLTDPLAPPGHLARVDREGVLEELLAAEELPVGVLDPAANGLFVGDALVVLEVMESSQQSAGDCGPAIVGAVEGTELAGQSIPGSTGGTSPLLDSGYVSGRGIFRVSDKWAVAPDPKPVPRTN